MSLTPAMPVSRDAASGAFGRVRNGVVAAAVLTLAAALAARWLLDVRYAWTAIALDLLLLLPVAIGVALATKKSWQPWLVMLVAVLIVVLGHAVKIAWMGAPIYASDFGNGVELFRVMSGWRQVVTAIAVTGLVGLLLVALWSDQQRYGWLILVCSYVLVLPVLAPLFISTEGDSQPPVDRVLARGGISYLLYSKAMRQHDMQSVPTKEEVVDALDVLQIEAPMIAKEFNRRSVHAVLLESIWDVTQLSAYKFSDDPFDPRFRAAWRQSGYSHILSPAFGGATANAEFEFLCGLPALRDQVTFAVGLKKPLPCLPRVLREAGYFSVAAHPYLADFWSRDRAYPLVGFELYRPVDAFVLDDFDGAFLNDQSTYQQVIDWAEKPNDPRPKFSYVVSLSSHFPYDRDRQKRPDIIQVNPDAPILQAYANAARYSTAAAMDYVEKIRANDPDALVILFGDHAPVLGSGPDPYRLSGLGLSDETVPISHSYPILASTPLLVFDGHRGPVNMGQLPLHRLAARVLALLGPGHPVLPQSPKNPDQSDAMRGSRLFFGHLMVPESGSQWRACGSNDIGCTEAEAARSAYVKLRDDLIRGQQYALALLHVNQLDRSATMAVARDYANCALDVSGWGPKKTSRGTAFNTQPDGGSVFWFSLRSGRGAPSIRVGDIEVAAFIAARNASANIGKPDFLNTVGDYPVTWQCPDGSGGLIGLFTVEAPPAPRVAAAADVAEPCHLAVDAWGPVVTGMGKPFNVQADGRSAFWFKLADIKGHPKLYLDGRELALLAHDQLGSTSIAADDPLLSKVGKHPLTWSCSNGSSGVIGEFSVQ